MTSSRRPKSVRAKSKRRVKGGGRKCDTWRTRLAVLQGKLAQKSKYRGINRLGKQLQRIYLDILVHFCDDRYRKTPEFEHDIDSIIESLETAFSNEKLTHLDLMKAHLKIHLTTAGVRGALATRLLNELSDPQIASTDGMRRNLAAKMISAIYQTHHHPIY